MYEVSSSRHVRQGGTGDVPRRLAGTSEADPAIKEPHRSKRGSITRTLLLSLDGEL